MNRIALSSLSPPFFFNDPPNTELYTLSLHDALPIFSGNGGRECCWLYPREAVLNCQYERGDRKSTRLNSSHSSISYAVFCLKKKNTNQSNGLSAFNPNHRRVYYRSLDASVPRVYDVA